MSQQPGCRRQTRATNPRAANPRAANLRQLLRPGGMFQPPPARAVRRSEVGLSRILFDLKAEGLIEDVRPAPCVGGPTVFAWHDGFWTPRAVEVAEQLSSQVLRR